MINSIPLTQMQVHKLALNVRFSFFSSNVDVKMSLLPAINDIEQSRTVM